MMRLKVLRSVFGGWRHRQRVCCSPAFLYSSANRLCGEASASRPISDAQRLTIEREKSIASRIVHLFQVRHPQAIFRTIPKVIVSAFQFMFRCWSWPHVFVKIHEVIKPSLAYGDTSATVVLENVTIGLCAANNHSSVNVIFGSFIHAVAIEARCELATAPTCPPTSQACTTDKRFASTFTSTTPKNYPSGSLIRGLNCSKATGNKPPQIIFSIPMRSVKHAAIIGVYGH